MFESQSQDSNTKIAALLVYLWERYSRPSVKKSAVNKKPASDHLERFNELLLPPRIVEPKGSANTVPIDAIFLS